MFMVYELTEVSIDFNIFPNETESQFRQLYETHFNSYSRLVPSRSVLREHKSQITFEGGLVFGLAILNALDSPGIVLSEKEELVAGARIVFRSKEEFIDRILLVYNRLKFLEI